MLEEEPPDEVVVISEPLRPCAPREEEQARHFEPAGCQDEELRSDGEFLPVHAGEAEGANRASVAVGLDLDGGGMEVNVEVRRGLELRAERLPEAQQVFGDDVKNGVSEAFRIKSRRPPARTGERPLPGGKVVPAGAEAACGVGSLVVDVEIAKADRPAAVRDPGAGFEVDLVEGPRPAAPVIRRAAEIPEPREIQRKVGYADALAREERRRRARLVQAARLDESDAERPAGELPRERDARSAGSRDAHVGLDALIGRQASSVDEHALLEKVRNPASRPA